MPNSFFQFKQFTVLQERSAMKVTTDNCLFGAWVANKIKKEQSSHSSSKEKIIHALDIGTGTGLLSMMLAQENTNLTIDAIEIDKATYEQATENIAASAWSRIKTIHADAKDYHYAHKFDIIISNPPFYENELKSADAKKNLAHHDEGLQLPGLLDIIKKNLSPNGTFYLLLPYKRNEAIQQLLLKNDFDIIQTTFVRQTVHHDFFRIMLSGKQKGDDNKETRVTEMAIKDGDGQYTKKFKSLLKGYYLYL